MPISMSPPPRLGPGQSSRLRGSAGVQVDPLAVTLGLAAEGNRRYDVLHVAIIVAEVNHGQRVHH